MLAHRVLSEEEYGISLFELPARLALSCRGLTLGGKKTKTNSLLLPSFYLFSQFSYFIFPPSTS